MSAEDLEKYETEMELQLYREYRDVVGLFSHVVETERRFYLTNQVELNVRQAENGEVFFEVTMQDAWVWDPVCKECAGCDVQGCQRRGTRQERPGDPGSEIGRNRGATCWDVPAITVIWCPWCRVRLRWLGRSIKTPRADDPRGFPPVAVARQGCMHRARPEPAIPGLPPAS
jgi:hypothetical protein